MMSVCLLLVALCVAGAYEGQSTDLADAIARAARTQEHQEEQPAPDDERTDHPIIIVSRTYSRI